MSRIIKPVHLLAENKNTFLLGVILIQAHMRGSLVRIRLKKYKTNLKSVLKIQSFYRGAKKRREISKNGLLNSFRWSSPSKKEHSY